MNADTVNSKTQFNNKQSNYWYMKLKDSLDQSKQSIHMNNYEHPTCTLAMTFLYHAGTSNPYGWF